MFTEMMEEAMCQEVAPNVVVIHPIGKDMMLEQHIIGGQYVSRRIKVICMNEYIREDACCRAS